MSLNPSSVKIKNSFKFITRGKRFFVHVCKISGDLDPDDDDDEENVPLYMRGTGPSPQE